MNSTAIHEASHCAAAWLLNRRVAYCWRDVGSALPGETLGHARIPIDGKVEATQVPVCLVGYWSVNEPGWPPAYEDALIEKREGLGQVLLLLHATEEKYDKTVEFTRELLEDLDFIRLRDSIARTLEAVPYLDGEIIERLARIHFEEEELVCSS